MSELVLAWPRSTLRRTADTAYDVAAGVVGVVAILGMAASLAAPKSWR